MRVPQITVYLVKPLKGRTISYTTRLLHRDAAHVVVYVRWTAAALDLGLLNFAPNDLLYEHFYSDRWYNVFTIYSAAGTLKGWYCNIARPAELLDDTIISEDLELDLLVAADRSVVRLDDEDEFAARALDTHDPAAHAAALAAVAELRALVASGATPFDA